MKDEFDDNQEDYRSLDHEYWCDLLSNTEVKYNRNREATQTKRIATSKVAYHLDRNKYIRVPCKKMVVTGIIPN